MKENIKAPRHWPLWGESTNDRWIPPNKGPVTRKIFTFDDVIMNTINILQITRNRQVELVRVRNGVSFVNANSDPYNALVTDVLYYIYTVSFILHCVIPSPACVTSHKKKNKKCWNRTKFWPFNICKEILYTSMTAHWYWNGPQCIYTTANDYDSITYLKRSTLNKDMNRVQKLTLLDAAMAHPSLELLSYSRADPGLCSSMQSQQQTRCAYFIMSRG